MKARKTVITIMVVVLSMLSTGVVFAGENGSESSTYINPSYKYESPSGSETAKETIVLNGLHSDSSLTAENSINVNAKLTTSGTLNKTYCFSVTVESISDNCAISSISADFDGTGLPQANAYNRNLSHNTDDSWSCILNGNTSGGYVSSFKIVVQHTCEYSETTEPSTCSEAGYIADECSCGHKEIKSTLDLLDHKYGDWKTINEPTVTNTGLKQRVCSICGFVDKAEIPRLEDVIDSGTLDDITWYVNTDYKLVISGAVNNLCGYDGPWYSYKDQIKSLVVSGDIRLVYGFGSYPVLESVTILDNVKEIAEFNGCTSLKSVKLPSEFWIINNETFANCTSLEEIIFPETVNYIGSGAFYGCTSLEEVVLPKMVVDYMGSNAYRGAFQGCTSLSRVVLPNNLEYIPESCFRLCSSLSSIEIPESVEGINNGAFADCSNLTDVYFKGASPNTIGNDVFSGTSNDLVIHYDPDTRGWEDNDIWDGYTLEPCDNSSIGDAKYDYAEVRLSSYRYHNGLSYANPPAVTVTNYKGKMLAEGSDYTVTYDSSPYTQGEHNVRVTGIKPFTFDVTVAYNVDSGSSLEWNSSANPGTVYFSKDADAQTLTIFGSGPMRDVINNTSYEIPGYCYIANDAVYLRGIKTIIVDEGVTAIGCKAFTSRYNIASTNNWFPNIDTIYIPSSVTEIKESALTIEGGFESVYIYSKNVAIADNSINAKNIYGYKNSTAYVYASKHSNITFHEICEYHDVTILNKKAPTCTTKGYSGDYACSVCREILREGSELDKLGHDYQADEATAVEPTCTEAGKEADKKCSRCESIIEGAPIPAKHNLIKHEAKPSSCTEEGNVEYYECSACKKSFVDLEGEKVEVSTFDIITPLADHQFGDWTVLQNPTCTKKGIRARYCKHCTAEERHEIDYLDHDWSTKYTVDTPATCSSEGSESIHCSVCGTAKEGSSRTIEKTSHNYGDWNTTMEPTVDAEGSKERICSICGLKETEIIDKLSPAEAEKVAAKETLKNTVSDAKKFEKGNYTDESYKAFQDAIATAEALAKDPNATAAQLKAAADKVAAAKAALKEKGAEASVAEGTTANDNSGNTFIVTSADLKEVAFTKAKNKKSVVVPATVKINGEPYKVTQINANAFKGSKIRTITIGKNVKVIKKNAFKGSPATKLILKTNLLKKAKVKGCLKGSKIKTVQVKVGNKATNKKFVSSYKNIFTKANAGKKVTIK